MKWGRKAEHHAKYQKGRKRLCLLIVIITADQKIEEAWFHIMLLSYYELMFVRPLLTVFFFFLKCAAIVIP